MESPLTPEIHGYQEWLRAGFIDLNNPDRAHLAFAGAGIRPELPILPQLTRLYQELLDHRARRDFRSVVAKILPSLRADNNGDLRIALQLFRLAAAIGAEEALDDAYRLLERPALKASATMAAREVRLAGWQFIASLTANVAADDYVRAAYVNTDDQNLREALFLSQCRRRPSQWGAMTPEFLSRLGETGGAAMDWPLFLLALKAAVGLPLLAQGLPRLPYRFYYDRPLSSPPLPKADDCTGLAVRLFLGQSLPFRLERRADAGGQRWILRLSDRFETAEAEIDLDSSPSVREAGAPGAPFRALLENCVVALESPSPPPVSPSRRGSGVLTTLEEVLAKTWGYFGQQRPSAPNSLSAVQGGVA